MKIPTEWKVVQAGKQWPWCVVASAVSRLHTVSIILIIITVLPLELQTKDLEDFTITKKASTTCPLFMTYALASQFHVKLP